MKSLALAVLGLALLGCQGNAQDKGKTGTLKTQKDSVSYTIGLSIGKNMKMQDVDIDPDLLLVGLKAALGDDSTKIMLTEQQMSDLMQRFQMEMMAKQQEKMRKEGEENKKKGDEFLAANKNKPGVQTTASGLQYKVIKEGTGPIPNEKSQLTVHYKGMLIDGKVFDSSYDRNQPYQLTISQVVPGWQEALKLMKEGSKWELYIPADLAYGQNGMPPTIPPNSVLFFELELIKVDNSSAGK